MYDFKTKKFSIFYVRIVVIITLVFNMIKINNI